jgi:hypothetical protein
LRPLKSLDKLAGVTKLKCWICFNRTFISFIGSLSVESSGRTPKTKERSVFCVYIEDVKILYNCKNLFSLFPFYIAVNPFSKHLSPSAFMSALPFTDAINTPILSFSLSHLPFPLEWQTGTEITDVEMGCEIKTNPKGFHKIWYFIFLSQIQG